MFQSSTLVKSYRFLSRSVDVAQAVDDSLCGGDTLSFIAWSAIGGALLAAILLPVLAYQMSGAEEVVYRRHAEVRSLSSFNGER